MKRLEEGNIKTLYYVFNNSLFNFYKYLLNFLRQNANGMEKSYRKGKDFSCPGSPK